MGRRWAAPAILMCGVAALVPVAPDWLSAAVAQYTSGGFGNGDPRTIPAFQQAVAETDALFRFPVPTDSGGTADLIRIFLSADLKDGAQRLPREAAERLRKSIYVALGHPSGRPQQTYSVDRAYVLVGRERRVVILFCGCGTSTLAMQAGDGAPFRSPQLDSRELDFGGF